MTKIGEFILSAVFLINVDIVMVTDTYDVLQEVDKRMFEAIDDLFIYLKINIIFTKPKNLEDFMYAHSFIQDGILKNHKIYKEIYKVVKTNVSNEMADKITGVNDVLNDMIRDQTFEKSIRNYTKTYSTKYDDLVDLERVYNMKLMKKIPNNFTIAGSTTSRELQGRRIFAGIDTGIERYPFMVSVHVARRFVCAGSLLHESLALTAASCVMRTRQDPTVKVQIRIGSDYVTRMGSLVHIVEIFYHPDFDRSTLANNLAFLKTKRALRFAQKKTMAIKYDKHDSVMLGGGKNIVILGWGRRSGSNQETMEDRPLSRARLDVYDLEECKYIYTRDYISETNFCAGFTDRGDGACSHDGGGPAVAGSLLTGVISFGSPQCGRTDAPTVFTHLALYAAWIESVLDSVNGSQINPHSFTVSSSIEFGNRQSSVESEDIMDVNPRDILIKQFGLADILKGPIDKENKKRIKNTSLLHPEIDQAEATPGATDQAEATSSELMSKPESVVSVVLENKELEEQKENEEIPNLTKDSEVPKTPTAYHSTRLMVMPAGDTDMMTETTAVYDDLAFQTASPTEPDEIETVTDANRLWTLGMSKDSDEYSDCDDSESQTEDESEKALRSGKVNEEIPILGYINETRVETEMAYIVLVNSGTTKRVKVDKDNVMYGKVLRVMKALMQNNNTIK